MYGGGLVSGPTTGNVGSGGAQSVGSRLNDLQQQILGKHPLIDTQDPLSQVFVEGLVDDLEERATKADLAAGLETREPVIGTGSLPQSKVASLVVDLSNRVTKLQFEDALALKQATVGRDSQLQISDVANLQQQLESKGVGTFLSDGTGDGASIIENSSGILRKVQGVDDIFVAVGESGAVTVSGQLLKNAIATKQNQIGIGDLGQDRVFGLVDALAGKAASADLDDKQDVIGVGGLAQDRVFGLVEALAGKLSSADLDSKQDVIGVGGLAQDRVFGLVDALAGKLSSANLDSKQDVIGVGGSLYHALGLTPATAPPQGPGRKTSAKPNRLGERAVAPQGL